MVSLWNKNNIYSFQSYFEKKYVKNLDFLKEMSFLFFLYEGVEAFFLFFSTPHLLSI